MKKILLSLLCLLGMVSWASADTVEIYNANFDGENDTHQTGNNSYTEDAKTYTASGVDWTINYADVANPTAAIEGYSCIGRVAKKTKNSPVMVTGAISSSSYKVTEISYDVKGNAAITVASYYSTDNGETWNELKSAAAATTAATLKVENLAITGAFQLKFVGTVSSSTASNRDFAIDNVVVKGEEVVAAAGAITITGNDAGTYNAPFTVTLSNTEGLDMKYALFYPGSLADFNAACEEYGDEAIDLLDVIDYEDGIEINASTTLIAWCDGYFDAREGREYWLQYAKPVINPKGGKFDELPEVTIELPENAPEGAFIVYTVDGIDPLDEEGEADIQFYEEPFTLEGDNVTVKAIVFDNSMTGAWLPSEVAKETYKLATFSVLVAKSAKENPKYYALSSVAHEAGKSLKAVEVEVVDGKVLVPDNNLLWMVADGKIVNKGNTATPYLHVPNSTKTDLTVAESSNNEWTYSSFGTGENTFYAWSVGESRAPIYICSEDGSGYFKNYVASNVYTSVKNTGVYGGAIAEMEYILKPTFSLAVGFEKVDATTVDMSYTITHSNYDHVKHYHISVVEHNPAASTMQRANAGIIAEVQHTDMTTNEGTLRLENLAENDLNSVKVNVKAVLNNDAELEGGMTDDAPSTYTINTATGETTGINAITFDSNVAPVYYNLQGVRIDAPAAGQVVIEVRGDKAAKTVIR